MISGLNGFCVWRENYYPKQLAPSNSACELKNGDERKMLGITTVKANEILMLICV